ncbi:hypothetical protein [Buchananella hordeovulneris]|uniref:hypothetical protein n=1 Tax=Buchananella hordeovulneris TaxID=52770 RepID=UPI000F5EFED1|nr:hypothetical protein [Buchananella hordeovulneris]MDO5081306.1 hypothetical protein [Buchananella hordeovulneris]RRD49923.1 hypothetical protein EII12_10020 [Buchananella hordeovulneris]
MPRPILVTAYGPFPGVSVNPTGAVLAQVQRDWEEFGPSRPLVAAGKPDVDGVTQTGGPRRRDDGGRRPRRQALVLSTQAGR